MQHNSPELISTLLDKMESSKFDSDIFEKTGVFVIRGGLPQNLIQEWKEEWDKFYESSLSNGRDVNVHNPVDLKESLPPKLANLYKNETLLNFVEDVFGKNIALFNNRFVIKDKFSPGPVFLHHDFGYHIGLPVKASFFVPLTYAGAKNGGLTFYPGTHKYGYLGDVGEIAMDGFNETWPKYTPELMPGDFAIMNSLVWHESGPNEIGLDRITADIIYQPANDPSSRELLRGEWQTDIFFKRTGNYADFFKRSRITKIIELTKNQKPE
jgi:hypothetical protein